jgi:predicted DNA-binding transcriptional regulator AlpA
VKNLEPDPKEEPGWRLHHDPAHSVEPFITLDAVMRLVGVETRSAVWKACAKGFLPQPYYVMGKSPRWRASEIEAAVLRRQRPTRQKAEVTP